MNEHSAITCQGVVDELTHLRLKSFRLLANEDKEKGYLAKVLYYVLRLLIGDVENQVSDAIRKVRTNVVGFIGTPHNDHMCDANLSKLSFLSRFAMLSSTFFVIDDRYLHFSSLLKRTDQARLWARFLAFLFALCRPISIIVCKW